MKSEEPSYITGDLRKIGSVVEEGRGYLEVGLGAGAFHFGLISGPDSRAQKREGENQKRRTMHSVSRG